MNKQKDFKPKKEMDERRKKNANKDKVGKITFWFTDNSSQQIEDVVTTL